MCNEQSVAEQSCPNVRRGRRYRFAVAVLAALLIGGGLASWLTANWLLAPAPCTIGDAPPDLPASSICLHSDVGGTVCGWHLEAAEPKGVVVLLHGIRGSRLSMLERARFLHRAGYAVVMIDLQGHGESPGECITLGVRESRDVLAAVDFARKKHPQVPIAVIGVSLGGASTVMAAPLGVDAVILESVFPDINSAVENRVSGFLGPLADVPAWLLLVQLQPRLGIRPDQLRPIEHIAKLECPVFVLSGGEDCHTTPEETRRLFQAAPDPKQLWIVPGAAHVDLHTAASVEYESKVLMFLQRHLSADAARWAPRPGISDETHGTL